MAPSSEVLRTCTLSLSKLQRLFCSRTSSSKTFAQTTFKGCDQKHTCRGKPAFGNKCCSNSVQNYSICSNKCKTIQNSGFKKSPILYPPQHKQPLSTQGPPSARWILSTQMFSVLITQSVRMLTATCRLFPWVNHFNMDLLNICILALYLHFCDVISHYFYFFNHFPADGQFRQKNVGRISHLYKTTVFTCFRKETNDITKVFKKTNLCRAYENNNSAHHKFGPSGIYQFCPDCGRNYTDQTGRNFKYIHKEHLHSFINNNNSKIFQHLLEIGHSFRKTDDVLQILHFCKWGIHGHNKKISYIYKEREKGNKLNDKQFLLTKLSKPNRKAKVSICLVLPLNTPLPAPCNHIYAPHKAAIQDQVHTGRHVLCYVML